MKRITKKIMILFLAAAFCASSFAPAVFANEEAVVIGGVKEEGIDRIVSYGNHVAGKIITGIGEQIDKAADSDVAGQITSWISTWVLGNYNTSLNARVARIEQLCNEILAELDEIEA